jgi:hypothetical protein
LPLSLLIISAVCSTVILNKKTARKYENKNLSEIVQNRSRTSCYTAKGKYFEALNRVK